MLDVNWANSFNVATRVAKHQEKQFINLTENTVNFIHFLTKELLVHSQTLLQQQELIVMGENTDPKVVITSTGKCIEHLKPAHNVVKTKLVLHATEPPRNTSSMLLFIVMTQTCWFLFIIR